MNINFDEDKFRRFKSAYKKALDDKKDSFIFEGGEWLVSYAKYVIEYLTPKFKK